MDDAVDNAVQLYALGVDADDAVVDGVFARQSPLVAVKASHLTAGQHPQIALTSFAFDVAPTPFHNPILHHIVLQFTVELTVDE
jgi:hypothetical protein